MGSIGESPAAGSVVDDGFDPAAFEAALAQHRTDDAAYLEAEDGGWTLVDGEYAFVHRSSFPQAPTGPGDADRYVQAWTEAAERDAGDFPAGPVSDALVIAIRQRQYAAAPHRDLAA